MHDFLGQAALLAELGGALADLPVERLEGGVVLVERRHLLHRQDDGGEVALGLVYWSAWRARLALEQQLHAAEPALDLPDPGDDAHRVEDVGRRLVGVVALRDGEDQTIGLRGGLDGAQGPRPPRGDRDREPGKITVPRNGRTGKDLRSAMMGPFSGFHIPRDAPRRSVRLVRQGKPIPSGSGLRQFLAQL